MVDKHETQLDLEIVNPKLQVLGTATGEQVNWLFYGAD